MLEPKGKKSDTVGEDVSAGCWLTPTSGANVFSFPVYRSTRVHKP